LSGEYDPLHNRLFFPFAGLGGNEENLANQCETIVHECTHAYSLYCETRTHLGLNKDTPLPRPEQRAGTIVSVPFSQDFISATRGYDIREGQAAPPGFVQRTSFVWRCTHSLLELDLT
jgi:hypothetical protein